MVEPRLSRISSLLFLVSLAACSVEEPSPPRPDASVPEGDAGFTCVEDPSLCEAGTHCDEGLERCVPNVDCQVHADCFSPSACVDGRCAERPRGCLERNCAANERCTPSGYCTRSLDEAGGLNPQCALASECSVGGQCIDGGCRSCNVDRPCPSPYVCDQGLCSEPSPCRASSDCFAGDRCETGVCIRPTDTCTPDPANDEMTGAEELDELYRTGKSFCGDDIDWYRVSLEAFVGARVVITTRENSNGLLPRLAAELVDASGVPLESTGRLLGPDRLILEIPGQSEARTVFLAASSNVNASYDIDLERVSRLCAGDALDIFGDEDPNTAPLVRRSRAEPVSLRACRNDVDHLRLLVSEDDQLGIQIEVGGFGGTRVSSSVRDDNGSLLSEATATATAPSNLELPRADADGVWTWQASVGNAPELGERYTITFDRESGVRYQACENATVLAGVTTFNLAADFELGEATNACLSTNTSSADRLYRIEAPRIPSLLRVTASPVTANGTANLGIALLSNCLRDSSLVECDASPREGLAASLEHVVTSTAPLFLMVSSDVPATEIELTVSFDEAGNFTCVGGRAEPITQSGVQSISTEAATNTDQVGSGSVCALSGDGAGPDRFYGLDLDPGQVGVLQLTGELGGFLWVGTNCERMTETCTAAASIEDTVSPAEIILRPGRSTSYIIAVDGLSAQDVGGYSLRTLIDPECIADAECPPQERCDDFSCAPAPANDQCPGEVVALPGMGTISVLGSTGSARDDYASDVCTGGVGGDDVVFEVVLTQPVASLRARIASANWDPLLYVRGNLCDTPQAEIGCEDDEDLAGGDLLPDLTLNNLQAGTYYIIVDTFSFAGEAAQGGPFEMEITVSP